MVLKCEFREEMGSFVLATVTEMIPVRQGIRIDEN